MRAECSILSILVGHYILEAPNKCCLRGEELVVCGLKVLPQCPAGSVCWLQHSLEAVQGPSLTWFPHLSLAGRGVSCAPGYADSFPEDN